MKIVFSTLLAFLIASQLLAQAPQKMSYQAVIRNDFLQLVTNTTIGMRTTILQGSSTGTVVYSETYNPNPVANANGLVSLEIGTGIVGTGNFSTIDWGNGPYYIKTETDIAGGTNYTIVAIRELLSVPFALHAANVTNYTDGQGIQIQNNEIALDKQNATNGQVLEWDGTGWTPGTDDTGASYLEGQGIDLSNNTIALAKQNATNGQILKWNGTAWTPGTDNTGSSYLPGQGIDLTNNTIALAKQNATVGQVLKWNGTAWAPGIDSNSTNYWSANGNNIYRNKGFVGIGTNNPAFPLDVRFANKAGVLNIMDEANDTSYRTPVFVNYHPSAKSGVGIQVTAGKSPFLHMDNSIYNPGSGHAGILSAGDNAGVVGTGAIGLIGIGVDGASLYGKEVGLFVQGKQEGLIVLTTPGNVAADIHGKLWLHDDVFEIFSANPNIIYPVATHFETTGNAGYFAEFGPSGNANLVNTTLNNKPDNNFLVMFSGTTQKAGMYLNATNQGVLFADVKNFRMKYPNKPGKEIWYASLEGPEAAAYVRGTAELVNGEAFVQFSEDFQVVGNAKTMTVVMTPGSADSKGLAVVSKTDKGFKVKELFSGKGNYSFDWEVKCVRKGYEDYKVVRDEEETKLDVLKRRGK